MPPPPGVVPNLVNPHSQGPTLIVVGSILISIMTVFVLVRGYTKYHIVRKASWDDCQSHLLLYIGGSES